MNANGDEQLTINLEYDGPGSAHVIAFGNFHKTLPHNRFGEVEPGAYTHFAQVASYNGDYETVASGPIVAPFQAPFAAGIPNPARADKLNNPQAARSNDKLTGPPSDYSMPPAPSVLSKSTAAEMTELQWMAMLRDVPFHGIAGTARFGHALADIRTQFDLALAANEPGGLRLGTDLPVDHATNALDLNASTLFRCGLKDEDKGPIVSQFFLHDIAYGAQIIQQKVRPYASGKDFLTDHGSWLRAQNTGYDAVGHGYSKDNDFVSPPPVGIPGLEQQPSGLRRISNMRDLARFVNKDALHQAYFNATLLCLNWGVPFDPGSPYATYKRQVGFGTFGGPDLLTRVSEVAGRALAVVWRQKWEVHRRLRPEAYGGLMQMQHFGHDAGDGHGPVKRAYGLPDMAFDSEASQIARQTGNKNLFLPIAFTAGSPPHPAYGAGHATVAGACVTVLKAWLDDGMKMVDLFALGAKHPVTDAPVKVSECDAGGHLIDYNGPGKADMTVAGELNKLACNVAMGRSMGGVHWRSDNTRSLRLGEQIASELLRGESLDYAEKVTGGADPKWSFTSFNGDPVEISAGIVRVNGNPVNPKAGPL